MKPVLLVTGAHGHLGKTLVRFFAAKLPEANILAAGRSKRNLFSDHGNVQEVTGDLRDPSTWESFPDSITHIIHLAASIPWKESETSPGRILQDNTTPIFHLVQKAVNLQSLCQVIYASSISVYAKDAELSEESPVGPRTFYGAAKLAGEYLLNPLLECGVKVCHLRLSSIYGNGQYPGTVLPLMMHHAIERKKVTIFNHGNRYQNFISLEDAALGFWAAYQKEASGTFNLGSSSNSSMLELARAIQSLFSPGEISIENKEVLEEDTLGCKVKVTKAIEELGFCPQYSLLEGLTKYKREMDLEQC